MTKHDTTKRDMPAAFYAAAGAGDLAYQGLRRLPEAATRTLRGARATAATLRERAASGELRINRDRIAADLATLRESAQRGATAFVATAAAAQERAVTSYRNLVAHGEHVVGTRAAEPAAEETFEPAAEEAIETAVEPAGELSAAHEEADVPEVRPGAEAEQPSPGEPVPPVKTKKAAATKARKSTKSTS
jgi:heparin binding hemagglutinin HbhA